MENLSQKEEIKAKAADYLDIVRSFSELLREENDALEKFETDKVAALYEQKVKLVTAYRSFVAFFIKNQEGLKLLDQEDKLTLREEALKLDELQHENSKLLQTRMKVSQTIMDSIVNLAKTVPRHTLLRTEARASIRRWTTVKTQ